MIKISKRHILVTALTMFSMMVLISYQNCSKAINFSNGNDVKSASVSPYLSNTKQIQYLLEDTICPSNVTCASATDSNGNTYFVLGSLNINLGSEDIVLRGKSTLSAHEVIFNWEGSSETFNLTENEVSQLQSALSQVQTTSTLHSTCLDGNGGEGYRCLPLIPIEIKTTKHSYMSEEDLSPQVSEDDQPTMDVSEPFWLGMYTPTGEYTVYKDETNVQLLCWIKNKMQSMQSSMGMSAADMLTALEGLLGHALQDSSASNYLNCAPADDPSVSCCNGTAPSGTNCRIVDCAPPVGTNDCCNGTPPPGANCLAVVCPVTQ